MKRLLLGVFAGVAIVIPVGVWLTHPGPVFVWPLWIYRYGQLFGLLGFVLLFLQFVLSSRARLFERQIGLNALLRVHAVTGMVGVVLLLAHGAFLTAFGFATGSGLRIGGLRLLGVAGLVLVIVGAFPASIYRRLHLRYETWKAVHRAMWVVFPLVLIHALFLGTHVGASPLLRGMWFTLIAIYVLIVTNRVTTFRRLMRNPYQVQDVVQETPDTWTLELTGPSIDYSPGQFMLLRLERDGRLSDSHPFTISSSPTQDFLSITSKAIGDFTSSLDRTRPGDAAYVEAPYGVFSYLNHTGLKLAFIAGSIGITPFMSMLRYMRDTGDNRDVVPLWGNRTEHEIPFRGELSEIEKSLSGVKVAHVLSHEEDFPGEKGFITKELVERHVSGIRERQTFLCGPPAMMKRVGQTLAEMGLSKKQLHYERFVL